jgi:plastocyanin
MRPYRFWLLTLFGLFLSTIAFGADGSGKAGTVKGTITIGGSPASGVVVSVEGLPNESLKSKISNIESERAVIDQRDKKFIPHVLPVRVGTRVNFPNNDDAWHNVFSTSGAKKFDLGLYPPGNDRNVTFDKPGVVRILCNVHPHMEAYVVVKEHPFFALSDTRGNYRLDAVPVGRYRLEIWHPELGTKVEPFHMHHSGEVLAIDVDLKRMR